MANSADMVTIDCLASQSQDNATMRYLGKFQSVAEDGRVQRVEEAVWQTRSI